MNDLTFDDLSEYNAARAARWHPGFPTEDDWSVSDWCLAMCGEAGEAANIVKKMRRWETDKTNVGDPPMAELMGMLGEELADTIIYADLLATKCGINLPQAIIDKFNKVSEKQGFPERL